MASALDIPDLISRLGADNSPGLDGHHLSALKNLSVQVTGLPHIGWHPWGAPVGEGFEGGSWSFKPHPCPCEQLGDQQSKHIQIRANITYFEQKRNKVLQLKEKYVWHYRKCDILNFQKA